MLVLEDDNFVCDLIGVWIKISKNQIMRVIIDYDIKKKYFHPAI